MAEFDGLLERENARLSAALRRARWCLEVALDPDADEHTLREALHEARRALTIESVRESSGGGNPPASGA